MTDPDPQDEATEARMIGLSEQLDAANAAGRDIVGPRKPPGPGLATAIEALGRRGGVDEVRVCGHIDMQVPAVAWWTPTSPNLIACQTCHTVSTTAAPSSCYACRRPGQRTRRVRHLVEADLPTRATEHYVTALPPIIVDVLLCAPCRGDSPGRPGRKQRR